LFPKVLELVVFVCPKFEFPKLNELFVLFVCPKLVFEVVPPKGLLLSDPNEKVLLFVEPLFNPIVLEVVLEKLLFPKGLELFVVPEFALEKPKGLEVLDVLDPKGVFVFPPKGLEEFVPKVFDVFPKVFVFVDPKVFVFVDPKVFVFVVDPKGFEFVDPKGFEFVDPKVFEFVDPKVFVFVVDPKVFVDPNVELVDPKGLLVVFVDPKRLLDVPVEPKPLLAVEPKPLLVVEKPNVLLFDVDVFENGEDVFCPNKLFPTVGDPKLFVVPPNVLVFVPNEILFEEEFVEGFFK